MKMALSNARAGLSALVLAAGCATAAPSNVKVEFATQEEGLCTIVESPRLVQITCGSIPGSPEGVRHLRRYSFQRDEAGMPQYAKIEGDLSEGVLGKWVRCDVPQGIPLCSEVFSVYKSPKTYLPVERFEQAWRE